MRRTETNNEPAVKRKRGRPRKECKPGASTPAIVTAAAPESLLPFQVAPIPLSAPLCGSDQPPLSKDILIQRVSRRLDIIDKFLSDDKNLMTLLSVAASKGKLHDIGTYESNLITSFLDLTGDPSVLVGHAERGQLQSVLPKILALLEKRGLIATATERKLEVSVNGGSGSGSLSSESINIGNVNSGSISSGIVGSGGTNGPSGTAASAQNAVGNERTDVIDALGCSTA
ncbi:MAG: hypothetical protein L0287_37925 [Anaerolineae bacterium]|nr:hypothetical protein [Anaerolineae bacterium]